MKPKKTVRGKYKYGGLTKDGYLIKSNRIKDFKLHELLSFKITETMTETEVRKRFARDYNLPTDFKTIKGLTVLTPNQLKR